MTDEKIPYISGVSDDRRFRIVVGCRTWREDKRQTRSFEVELKSDKYLGNDGAGAVLFRVGKKQAWITRGSYSGKTVRFLAGIAVVNRLLEIDAENVSALFIVGSNGIDEKFTIGLEDFEPAVNDLKSVCGMTEKNIHKEFDPIDLRPYK